jgi:hypothetical protein
MKNYLSKNTLIVINIVVAISQMISATIHIWVGEWFMWGVSIIVCAYAIITAFLISFSDENAKNTTF